ncbi:hypothetical protein B0T16DRAFT_399478 [Cercophora newfieldiana]|uniref:Uncharacterized protein n=1 Tax=Cercophora newfieldiana TaxID=92897 RepID=A0AA40CYU6_9PEZI|nr:hypothetical protein B0T16DRAFT_399478 [Cercophora newfieldiana]
MAGYANGGDAEWNKTSQNTGARLGNGDNSYTLNGPEIAVIIVTISLFVIAMFLVFYCRSLQMRRKMDIKNQERERKTQAAVAEGETIELQEGNSVKNEATDFKPASSEVGLFAADAMSDRARRIDLESGQIVKRPLWYYIHWKDPCNNPKPKVQPRPQPEEGTLQLISLETDNSPLCQSLTSER